LIKESHSYHFDIKYFYVTDLIGRDEVEIEYCSTGEMLADYNTKPVVGRKFLLFRDRYMNLTGKPHCWTVLITSELRTLDIDIREPHDVTGERDTKRDPKRTQNIHRERLN
jgi:hypothetical protein